MAANAELSAEDRPLASITTRERTSRVSPLAKRALTPTARSPSKSTSRTTVPVRTVTPWRSALSSSMPSNSLRNTCQVWERSPESVSEK